MQTTLGSEPLQDAADDDDCSTAEQPMHCSRTLFIVVFGSLSDSKSEQNFIQKRKKKKRSSEKSKVRNEFD